MRRASVKKVSIRGLVLIGVSVITVAILPNKADTGVNELDVTLTQRDTPDGDNVYTCKFTVGWI